MNINLTNNCDLQNLIPTKFENYTYEEICGHLLLLMYMAKIAAGTTMSTYLPLIGLHKL